MVDTGREYDFFVSALPSVAWDHRIERIKRVSRDHS